MEGHFWRLCQSSDTLATAWQEILILEELWQLSSAFIFAWADIDRTRGDRFKLKEGRSWLDIRKKLFAQQWSTGTGCPEELGMPHHWRCWRPGCRRPWATYLASDISADGWEVGTRWFARSRPSRVVLCDSTIHSTASYYRQLSITFTSLSSNSCTSHKRKKGKLP